MATLGGIYYCELCGQEILVVKKGTGILRCCGEVMKFRKKAEPADWQGAVQEV